MNELLPCPFCGGEAKVVSDSATWKRFVKCKDCGLRTQMFNGLNDAEAEAVQAWNTRAERTCRLIPSPETSRYELLIRSVGEWCCDECNTSFYFCFYGGELDFYEKPNYCPNCGARVVEE